MPPRKPSGRPDRHTKGQTSVRLTDTAKEALKTLAERQGITATAVVEMLIREKARTEGLKVKGL